MTNQDERTLLAGLRALKQKAAGESAPKRVEGAVLAGFRAARVQPRSRKTAWWIAGAAIAASIAIVIAVYTARTPAQQARVATVDPAPPPPVIVDVQKPPVVKAAVRKVKPRKRRAVPAPVVSAAVTESTTDFLPVVSAPPLLRGERASVVRVDLPRSSLRAFGLPYTEERRFERVNADVVVGEDGLIRAVRFVK